MNQTVNSDLPVALELDAGEEATLDHYFAATKRVLEDIQRNQRRMDKRKAENDEAISQLFVSLGQLRG